MARQTKSVEPRKPGTALEHLIEAVENGEIEAIEDLTREEISWLLARARPGESLEDLFDRLRGTGRERE